MARLAATLAAVVAVQLTTASAVTAAAPSRPDIIVLLADDLGFGDVGFTAPARDAAGAPAGRFPTAWPTPALDAWARGGVVLDRLYSHTWCAPTRAALLTGRFAHASLGPGPQLRLLEGRQGAALPAALRDAGYRTGHVGKWHLSGAEYVDALVEGKADSASEAARTMPNAVGFEHSWGFLRGDSDYVRPRGPAGHALGGRFGWVADGAPIKQPWRYATDALAEAAVDFVAAAANDTRPYFLYLAPNAPHLPLQAKQEDKKAPLCAQYGAAAERGDHEALTNATYCGMVVALDRLAGTVRAAVEALPPERARNTLVVFASDNGSDNSPWAGQGDGRDETNGLHMWRRSPSVALPLAGTKGTTFEGGVRAPAFVSWPAALGGGEQRSTGAFMHVVDLAPTLLDAAGAKLEPWRVHGVSRLAQMLARKGDPEGLRAEGAPVSADGIVGVECAGDHKMALHTDGWKWSMGQPEAVRFARLPTLQRNARLRYAFVCQGFAARAVDEPNGTKWLSASERRMLTELAESAKGGCETEGSAPSHDGVLIDLLADIGERTDLAAQMPDVAAEMRSHTIARCQDTT